MSQLHDSKETPNKPCILRQGCGESHDTYGRRGPRTVRRALVPLQLGHPSLTLRMRCWFPIKLVSIWVLKRLFKHTSKFFRMDDCLRSSSAISAGKRSYFASSLSMTSSNMAGCTSANFSNPLDILRILSVISSIPAVLFARSITSSNCRWIAFISSRSPLSLRA